MLSSIRSRFGNWGSLSKGKKAVTAVEWIVGTVVLAKLPAVIVVGAASALLAYELLGYKEELAPKKA